MDAGPSETLASAAAAGGGGSEWMERTEVDASAPFESVREAVDHFGGGAPWKPQHRLPEDYHYSEEVDVEKMGQETAYLESDLIVKERETLEVLTELEKTREVVHSLKIKLQNEASEARFLEQNSDSIKVCPYIDMKDDSPTGMVPKHSPGLILMELQEAKVSLNRATGDSTGIRAAVILLNNEVEKERALLRMTHKKLNSNTASISVLEDQLNQTTLELKLIKDAERSSVISKQIEQLTFATEQSKKLSEAAKCEVSKLTAEIEDSRANINITEIRLLAAKKVEESAKAAEAIALAEIDSLMNSGMTTPEFHDPGTVTLPIEEYMQLARKAQDADDMSRIEIEATMRQLDEAKQSKVDLLMKVEEAAAEFKVSKETLKEALERVDIANREKLAAEEALRRWRSERGQKRHSIQNSPRFKNPCPSSQIKDAWMSDLNAPSLASDSSRSVSRSLSIGQILSRKITSPEEYELGIKEKTDEKLKMSLGEFLSRGHGVQSPQRTENESASKRFSIKKKTLVSAGFALLLAKQKRQKKKRQKRSLR